MRSEHHDAIVIGASTAGVTVAGALAASGRSVLLLDRNADALAPTATTPVPLFRLRQEDFGRLEHFDGESPAWPIDPDELVEYYALAEQMCAARGRRGIDPTEPPARRPFPLEPESPEPAMQALTHRLRAAGLRPFPTPMGLPPSGAPAGCDAMVATAIRIETDSRGGTARAVIVEREGRRARITADAVILAAGAIGSAALLLRSASDAHPAGLANGSGVVGRNLVRRTHGLMLALLKREVPEQLEPGFSLNDFYLRAPGWRYPGGHVRMVGSAHRQVSETGSAYPGRYGARAVQSLDLLLSAEGLASPDNRVTVCRNGEVVVHYRPTNLVGLRKLGAHVRQAMTAIGAPCVNAPIALHPDAASRLRGASGSGTVRMGTDPARSAVNPEGRSHEVENLWVVDASTFPSGSALEPTLSLVALALRAEETIDATISPHTLVRSVTPATAGGRAA